MERMIEVADIESSSRNTYYTIRRSQYSNIFECNCQDFFFRRKIGEHCKHIKKFIEYEVFQKTCNRKITITAEECSI